MLKTASDLNTSYQTLIVIKVKLYKQQNRSSVGEKRSPIKRAEVRAACGRPFQALGCLSERSRQGQRNAKRNSTRPLRTFFNDDYCCHCSPIVVTKLSRLRCCSMHVLVAYDRCNHQRWQQPNASVDITHRIQRPCLLNFSVMEILDLEMLYCWRRMQAMSTHHYQ